jgi:O-antigen/teichoic acid export membrane protein
LTLSVLLPWLWSARRLWDPSVHGLRHWTRWDYSYGGKFVATTLFANQLGAIDLLVAGVLFSSTTVADYAVAARIAALYSFFQLAMLKRFAPRVATLIETRNFSALRQEANACRHLMIACGALTIGAALCVAPFILPLFGNYGSAGIFLIWLAIPTYVQSFYETSDRLLIIAGQPNVPLTINACSFLVLAIMPFFTAPLIGLASIPVAMIVSALLFNPIISVRVKALFAITTIHRSDVILILMGAGALATSAIVNVPLVTVATCALLGAIGLHSSISALKWMKASPATDSQVGGNQARAASY